MRIAESAHDVRVAVLGHRKDAIVFFIFFRMLRFYLRTFCTVYKLYPIDANAREESNANH